MEVERNQPPQDHFLDKVRKYVTIIIYYLYLMNVLLDFVKH